MRRKINCSLLLVFAAVALVPVTCEAQKLIYDFVESRSGDVLATLELSSLPATHTEVISLAFSTLGAANFGYSSVYTGGFDTTGGIVVDDGFGGLRGPSSIEDLSPATSSVFSGTTTRLHLGFLGSIGRTGRDTIILLGRSAGIAKTASISKVGDWRLVPEPHSLWMFLTAVSSCAIVRRQD